LMRTADHADYAASQIFQTAYVIDDGKIGDVIEKRIDRDIASEGVFIGSAERGIGVDVLGALFFRLLPEGGHLDDLPSLEPYMGEPEPSADEHAVGKKLLHLPGPGIGDYIEILWLLSEEQIPDRPAHQV